MKSLAIDAVLVALLSAALGLPGIDEADSFAWLLILIAILVALALFRYDTRPRADAAAPDALQARESPQGVVIAGATQPFPPTGCDAAPDGGLGRDDGELPQAAAHRGDTHPHSPC